MTPTVVAIIVTHDRPEVLAETLESVRAQTFGLAGIIVVDSGSSLAESRKALADHTDVRAILLDDNVGYGAALSVGIEAAAKDVDPDFFWLLDDDSPVSADSLASVVALAGTVERVGIIGTTGGRVRLGMPRWVVPPPPGVHDVHYCMVDGALLSREAVSVAGTPRRDFFMMHEDFEYTSRIRSCGLRVLTADAVSHAPMHLGTSTDRVVYWRDYYQSRNHLRFMLDRGSALGVVGWFLREVIIVTMSLRRGRAGFTKARVVVRGARDALRNRMGRTIEPGSI